MIKSYYSSSVTVTFPATQQGLYAVRKPSFSISNHIILLFWLQPYILAEMHGTISIVLWAHRYTQAADGVLKSVSIASFFSLGIDYHHVLQHDCGWSILFKLWHFAKDVIYFVRAKSDSLGTPSFPFPPFSLILTAKSIYILLAPAPWILHNILTMPHLNF